MTRKAREGDLRQSGNETQIYKEDAQKFVPATERDIARMRQQGIRRSNRGNVDAAQWHDCDPALLHAAVCAVTRFGFAIRFGYTRDGGAFAVGIIGDGDPYTEFIRPSEDIDVYLASVRDDFNAAAANEFAASRE